MNVFNLYGDVDVRTGNAATTLSGLQTKAQKLGQTFKNMGSKISAAGKTMMSFTTIPIAAALGYSVKAASDLNETLSKTEVVFGKNADEVKAWSTTTLGSFGLAQGTALDMAATYGDMGTAMGLNIDKASEMSMSITGLAGDMASFKNMKPEEVHTALTGIYTGETEALKSLGIVMTETNLAEYAKQQGIKKSIKDMTQAEKVQLRYNYVMDASSNSIGDFARTQDSAANQMRIAQESLKELAAGIGTILLPTVVKILQFINKWIAKFKELDPGIQGILVKVALLVGAVAPLLIVLGGVISVIGTLITIISAVSIEVIAVIALIAGLAAGIAAVVVKTVGWQTIWTKIQLVMTTVGDLVKTVWEAIQSGSSPLAAAVMWLQNMAGAGSELSLKIGALYASWLVFYNQVSTLLASLWAKWQEAWTAIWNIVKPFFDRLVAEVLPIFMDVVSEILGLLGEMATNFKKSLDSIWKVWKKIWDLIKPYVKTALNNVVEIIKAAFTIIKNVVKLLRAALKGDFKGMWDAVKNIVKAAVKAVVNIARNLNSDFNKQVKSLVTKAVTTIGTLKSKMLAKVNAIKSGMKQAGKNIMNMFIEGISSKITKLTNMVSKAANTVKDYLGFSSPTKKGAGKTGDKWAPNLMKMYREGIIKGLPAIQRAIATVSSSVSDELNVKMGSTMVNATATNQDKQNSNKIELIVNNPKFFDYNDINKFMNPITTRLKQLGYKGV